MGCRPPRARTRWTSSGRSGAVLAHASSSRSAAIVQRTELDDRGVGREPAVRRLGGPRPATSPAAARRRWPAALSSASEAPSVHWASSTTIASAAADAAPSSRRRMAAARWSGQEARLDRLHLGRHRRRDVGDRTDQRAASAAGRRSTAATAAARSAAIVAWSARSTPSSAAPGRGRPGKGWSVPSGSPRTVKHSTPVDGERLGDQPALPHAGGALHDEHGVDRRRRLPQHIARTCASSARPADERALPRGEVSRTPISSSTA